MTYASQNDLVKRFGEPMLLDLTDRASPPANEIDTDVVTQSLQDADATINAYLAARYALPLASTPDVIRSVAIDITIYKLHRDTASEKITADYNAALKTLNLLSSGVMRLDVAGIEPATNNASGVRVTDRERPFTADNMKGFI